MQFAIFIYAFAVSSFSYEQVHENGDISKFTISVNDNVMNLTIVMGYPDEPQGGSNYEHVLITFSSDYSKATVNGYATAHSLEHCQGSIEGTLTRIGEPIPPVYAVTQGKVTDAVTGEPIQGATISLEPGAITLTAQAEGTFSSSEIPARTYSAQISAPNYNTKATYRDCACSGASQSAERLAGPLCPEGDVSHCNSEQGR